MLLEGLEPCGYGMAVREVGNLPSGLSVTVGVTDTGFSWPCLENQNVSFPVSPARWLPGAQVGLGLVIPKTVIGGVEVEG